MLTPLRLMPLAVALSLVSGCSLDRLWNDAPAPPPPSVARATVPTSDAPPQDERTLHPYTGALADSAECRSADKELLGYLEEIGGVGSAVTYPIGVRVHANAGWWAVAVATSVERGAGGNVPDDLPAHEVFVTNVTSVDTDDAAQEWFSWRLSGTAGDAAASKALACVKKLRVPAQKPDPTSPDSYTGALSRRACVALTAAQLDRFEDAGQVGGAITYPRGVRVKANLGWWTVAVATQVNPNSQGLTRENVPRAALFVTNAPTRGAKSSVTFPLKPGRSDAAARRALACLGG